MDWEDAAVARAGVGAAGIFTHLYAANTSDRWVFKLKSAPAPSPLRVKCDVKCCPLTVNEQDYTNNLL